MSSTMLSKTLVLLFAGLVTAELNIEIQKKYEELSSSEFVTYFNGLNLTWSITEYPEQHHFMLGAREEKSRKSLPVVHHEGTLDLPENFDSREKWPHCDSISTIRDQGRCASSWIFAVVDTASDRNCINADIHVLLSQAEGTCMANASVCDGGYPEESFNYWFEKGLVTNQCENYTVNKAMEGQCKTECENPQINYNEDKHFRANVFKVDNHSIRVEIVGYGSVQAMMMVYEDFKQYKGGIYDYKFGKFLGLQAVRIIGYGTEGDVDYWLIANSWGTTWGEKGFVRIKRFTGLRLEDTVLAGMPALF